MTLSLIIVLVLIGLLLLILEILVIPGTGVVGIIGFIMIALGIYYSYTVHGALTGHLVLGSSLVLSVAGVVLSIRSKTWKYAMLNTKLDGKAPSADDHQLQKGDIGTAVSRLAPAGTAVFDDIKIEVHTQGDFVDPGTRIEIFKIDQRKVFVKPINN